MEKTAHCAREIGVCRARRHSYPAVYLSGGILAFRGCPPPPVGVGKSAKTTRGRAHPNEPWPDCAQCMDDCRRPRFPLGRREGQFPFDGATGCTWRPEVKRRRDGQDGCGQSIPTLVGLGNASVRVRSIVHQGSQWKPNTGESTCRSNQLIHASTIRRHRRHSVLWPMRMTPRDFPQSHRTGPWSMPFPQSHRLSWPPIALRISGWDFRRYALEVLLARTSGKDRHSDRRRAVWDRLWAKGAVPR